MPVCFCACVPSCPRACVPVCYWAGETIEAVAARFPGLDPTPYVVGLPTTAPALAEEPAQASVPAAVTAREQIAKLEREVESLRQRLREQVETIDAARL